MNLFRTTSRRLLPKRSTYHRTLFSLPSFPPSGEQTYHEQKIFPYKRSELYAIVSDVSSYPQFIPYCTGSRILHKATHDGSTIMDAELTVGFMAFQESYVSKVTCTPFSSVEAVASSSTPMFKSLKTIWRFQPAGEKEHHTLVSLDLAFDFVNPLYASLSSAFFDKVSGGMVMAFEKRCDEVCGRGRV